MLRHEYILACRYWLGISIFPDSQQAARCPCGHVMDCFGDHVLGCGHGPLRIKRHNAISEVIWHALLVDNRDSKREQKCGGESNNRPGDSLRNMPSFYLSKVPVYLARPPEHTTRCFSKSRTVMNTTMCVKWLLQQDSTTRSHSGGGMLAKCTPLTGRTCRVSQT